jgi:hypothetical protein
MKTTLPALAFAALLSLNIGTASAAVVDSVNESGTPYSGIDWNAIDIGWVYTPLFSYVLNGVNTKFASGDGRTVTEVIYAGIPSSGGTLLASATFTPVANVFSGGTFNDVQLDAGSQYFVGFINVNGLLLNVTADPGAVELPTYYSFVGRLSQDTFATGPQYGRNGQPILEFVSTSVSVPEPATVALLGLGLVGFAMSRRKSST